MSRGGVAYPRFVDEETQVQEGEEAELELKPEVTSLYRFPLVFTHAHTGKHLGFFFFLTYLTFKTYSLSIFCEIFFPTRVY